MVWTVIISIAVLLVFSFTLARAAQPAKARSRVRQARCPICDGLGFVQGALTRVTTGSGTMCTAKCNLCGDRIKFDRKGKPLT